ncbi:hypothetical protein CLF_102012 [Clonorchis sinensis]|uniref:Uncharacterized protein n=1 Tax=Clonorchis sinensis TaxID=79923 RepID=G7Y734_CLOSI|nr:hypothetical protein CLF_102012 [Clonorchis sinensis]
MWYLCIHPVLEVPTLFCVTNACTTNSAGDLQGQRNAEKAEEASKLRVFADKKQPLREVRQFVADKSGKILTKQDIPTTAGSVDRFCRVGAAYLDFIVADDMPSVLAKLREAGRVLAWQSEEGHCSHICFSRWQQIVLFRRFPDVVNVDGTHATNRFGLPSVVENTAPQRRWRSRDKDLGFCVLCDQSTTTSDRWCATGRVLYHADCCDAEPCPLCGDAPHACPKAFGPSKKHKGVLATRSAKRAPYDVDLDRGAESQDSASRESVCPRVFGSKEKLPDSLNLLDRLFRSLPSPKHPTALTLTVSSHFASPLPGDAMDYKVDNH